MKKKKRASSNRLMFFGTISVLIILFFVAEFIGFVFQVNDLNNEQITINNEINELKNKEDYLKNEIIKLKDPDYLARYARENYMYSKDGEYIIKVPEVKEEEVSTITKTDNKVWIASIVIGVGLILIIVLKKIF